MRTIALSKRDPCFTIVKQAGIIENFIGGAASSMKSKLQIRSKPFETILGTLGPYLFSKSLIGWGLWELAKHLGFDLFGWIGAIVDKFLGFGDPENPPDISKSNLKSASEEASGQVWNKVKDSLPLISSFSSYDEVIVKEARGANVARWRDFLTQIRRGGRLSIVGVIYKILSVVAIALLGSAVFGGASNALFGPKNEGDLSEESNGTSDSKSNSAKTNLKRYRNVHSNIEDSLIAYLNAFAGKIQANGMNYNFEQAFELKKNYPLKGSSEMRAILKEISALYNHTPIEELNQAETFYSPDAKGMIVKLLPELRKIEPSSQKKPFSKPRVKKDPKKELKQLLKGVFDD